MKSLKSIFNIVVLLLDITDLSKATVGVVDRQS